jgi:hypothetical protein
MGGIGEGKGVVDGITSVAVADGGGGVIRLYDGFLLRDLRARYGDASGDAV